MALNGQEIAPGQGIAWARAQAAAQKGPAGVPPGQGIAWARAQQAQGEITNPQELVDLARGAAQYPTPTPASGLDRAATRSRQLMDEAISGATLGAVQPEAWAAARKTQRPAMGYTNPLKTAATVISGPSFEQMEQAAKNDRNFSHAWEMLKNAMAESQTNYVRLGGEQGIAKLRSQLRTTIDSEVAAETAALRAARAPRVGGAHGTADRQTSVLTGRARDDEMAPARPLKGVEERLAERAIPGIQRMPLTPEEVAREGFRILQAQEAGALAELPWWARTVARAAPMGFTGGAIARGVAGGMTKAGLQNANLTKGMVAGFAQGAAAQAGQLVTGVRETVDPGELAIDTFSLGLAAKLGGKVGGEMGRSAVQATMRRFGDKAALVQDLVDAGALKQLEAMPSEIRAAAAHLLRGTQRAQRVAETITSSNDLLEIVADRALMQAQGQDPGPISHSILDAVVQSWGARAAGGGAPGRPERPRADLGPESSDVPRETMEPALERLTRPAPPDGRLIQREPEAAQESPRAPATESEAMRLRGRPEAAVAAAERAESRISALEQEGGRKLSDVELRSIYRFYEGGGGPSREQMVGRAKTVLAERAAPMRKPLAAIDSVARRIQEINERSATAQTTIGSMAAKAEAGDLLHDVIETAPARAETKKKPSVHAQAMLLGRDWLVIDKNGYPTKLTAKEAMRLSESLGKGDAKVVGYGALKPRRGRPGGLQIGLKDGRAIRVYRSDTSEQWEALRDAYEKGGLDKTEFLHSGGLSAIFASDPNEPGKEYRHMAAVETQRSWWDENIRGTFRDLMERVTGKRVAATAEEALFGHALPPDVRAGVGRVHSKVESAGMAAYAARTALDAEIAKIARGDKEVATDLVAAAFLAAQANARTPTGTVGVPQSHRQWLTSRRAKFGNERFDRVARLMENYGNAALKFNDLLLEAGMVPYAIWRKRDGTEVHETKEQSEGAPHADMELVGGWKHFNDQGLYFPHVYSLEESGRGLGGGQMRNLLQRLVGWRTKEIRSRLSRRFLSLEDALQRGLVMSHEPLNVALAAEAEAISRKMTADYFRDRKLIRNDEEMAGIASDQETASQIKALRSDLDAAKKELAAAVRRGQKLPLGDKSARDMNVEEKSFWNAEIRSINAALSAAEAALSLDGWTVLRGAEYGDYNSDLRIKGEDGRTTQKTWYIRRDLYGHLQPAAQRMWGMRVYGSVHSLVKSALAGGGNPLRFFNDKLTNQKVNVDAGFSPFTPEGRVEWNAAHDQVMRAKIFQKSISDELYSAFDFGSRDMSFGGPGELLEVDSAHATKAKAALVEAIESEKLGDAFAAGVELAAARYQAFLDKIKVFGPLRKLYRNMTDVADAYFVYRMARKYGKDNSGPMSHEDALAEAQRLYDVKNLSKAWSSASGILSYLRYRVKLAQQLIDSWVLEPSIYGRRIDLGLTRHITAVPGSTAAKRALFARGGLRQFTKYLEWKIPLIASTMAMLRLQGIDYEEWEKALDAKYRYWPSPIAWMLKQISFPFGRDDGGQIRIAQIEPFLPTISLLKYISSGGVDTMPWLASKNVLAQPIVQAGWNVNFANQRVPEGFLPRQDKWPLLTMVMPRIATSAAELVAKALETDPSADDLAMDLAEYLSGFKIDPAPDAAERELIRLEKQGVIRRIVDEKEGVGWWDVAVPSGHPLYKHANNVLGLVKASRASDYFARRVQRYYESFSKGLVR